ncbi:hypothetical protein BMS3Abin04_02502 [bacterium BMS3Abin04]|nr:hypothetical protein BMS3Abin04_02502 [bacterium BMS3Abin04]
MLGQKIVTLLNEVKNAGTYELSWDASGLSSGIYIYKLQTGLKIITRKMMLIK